WYDGDPARLKPAPAAVLAAELADLAGGAGRLAERAREVAAAGDLRLAGHLAELAAQAAPTDPGVHAARAEIFGVRAREEASTMAKGIFAWAEHESAGIVAGEPA
ncbi:MAG: alkyl sulfatase dimerization domain-containing protein, partial [Actinomycetota bacterium]